jgi:hypothetical protein
MMTSTGYWQLGKTDGTRRDIMKVKKFWGLDDAND